MMTGRVREAAFAFLLTGAMGLGVASPSTAQEREAECRCVDRDGTELENCVCVRTPRMERIVISPWAEADRRPRIGISLDVTDRADEERGARISNVLEDGPADRAGLEEGDVVTHIDGRSLVEPLDADRESAFDVDGSLPAQRLLALARELEPGDRLEIEYLRDGEARSTTVEAEDLADWGRIFSLPAPDWDAQAFGERMRSLSDRMRGMRAPRAPRAPGSPDAPRPPLDGFRFEVDGPDGPRGAWFHFGRGAASGLEMVPLNPELGSYFGAERGVLVTSVTEDGGLGLRAGDVILEVDGRAVETPHRVRSILATYDPDEAVTFRVRRDGREVDVSGRTGG
ncbi:MAG: PDZ domain-containing protein [Gemmatimonadota bacterium]